MNQTKKLFVFLLLALSLFLASCEDKDETPPTLSGYENITYIIGDTLPDLEEGLTVLDNVDGDLLSSIEVDSSAVNFTTPGVYTVTISVTDKAGNLGTATFTVTVVADTVGPVINGTQNYVLEQGSVAPNYLQGVTAIDNFDGDLTSAIVVDSSEVDYDVVGTYEVTYTVIDLQNNQTVKTVFVNITLDSELPVINGATNQTLEQGSTPPNFLQGVTATDNFDGNLTTQIVVDSSEVNYDVVGEYSVYYTVSDTAGNEVEVEITVTIVLETTPPVISNVIAFTLEQGEDAPNYLEGVLATDNFDGDLTDHITVDASAVNHAVVGTYPVIYTVLDHAGNIATTTTYVTVILETVAPVINGATDLVVGLNDTTFNYLQEVTALDNFDGDLTAQIQVNLTAIVISVEGHYPITYSVTDAAGNVSSITVSVHVKDLIPPVITGTRNLTFEVFSTPNFLWKDIRINDNLDGDLLSQIVIDSSQVNLSVLGTYPLTYSVTDSSGNTSSVTVQITIADRTKPVIKASSPIYFLEGDATPDYLSLATATDNYDGDVTDRITVNSSAVNLNVVGTYNVIYTVSDLQGNTTSLTIQLIVPNPLDVGKVNVDADNLLLPEAPITQSIVLPLSGGSGTTITWISLSPDVMTKLGNIIRPGVNQDDAYVELVATIKSGNYQKQFSYFVTVAALEEVTVTSQVTLNYTALGTDYITQNGTLDTYFVNGGSVPYVSIEEYLMLIKGALESDILEFTYDGHMMIISYDVEYEDIDGNIISQTLTAVIDFEANTMTVETFDFFSYYIASTTTNYGEGLEYVGADYVDPQPVTFVLGEYGFDLVIYNDGVKDNYLMPFHVTNLLFAGNVYFDVYYNGDQYYGLDTRQLYNRNDVNIPIIKTSTYNSATLPLDMKLAAYNFLGLSMDYFYGIKKFANVETYYDRLAPFIDTLVYSGDINFYQGIFKFIYGLDDLHSSHVFTGYYEPTTYSIPLTLQDLGQRSGSYYNRMWAVQDLYDAEFGSYTNVPFSRLTPDGKTAIIHIDGFAVDTPVNFKRALDDLPASVENVVVDIANNGGGNLGAVLRIFGYMTEQDIIYHSQNPADGSAVTYYIQSEYVAYPYNWFVMTSSVSFSAANLMASMAKELGIPVIGQNSSGGASSIGIILPPGGSSLLISTNNVLSARIINEQGEYVYLSIEYGITVDYKLSNVADDDEIQNLINLLTSGN